MKARPATAAVFMAVVLLAATTLVSAGTAAAAGDANTYYVNNNTFGYADGSCTPGDDSYDPSTSSNNQCSLGAAMTAANANSTPSNIMTVTLATDFAATCASNPAGCTITVDGSNSHYMTTAAINPLSGNAGSYYTITAPMTVDLKQALTFVTPGGDRTSFYINYAGTSYDTGVHLLNTLNIMNGMSSIVISNTSQYVTVSGGQTLPMTGYWIQQFLVIQNGAQHIIFSNYTVGNLYNSGDENCNSAAVCFHPGPTQSAQTQDVTITNITFTSTASSTNTSCGSSDSSGCVNIAIDFYDNSNVNGLEITNCTFTNLKKGTDTDAVVLSMALNTHVSIANMNFHNNTITNSGACTNAGNDYCALILLYHVQNSSNNYIQHNTFINNTSLNEPHAVSVAYNNDSTTANGIYIQDNYFDGFTASAIWLHDANLTTATRNTMGPNTFSNSNTTSEETGNQQNSMLTVTGNKQFIDTWYPTSDSLGWQGSSCVLQLGLVAPTSSVPTAPLTIDVYWTATTKAETYLGSMSGFTGPTAQITLSQTQLSSFLNADGTMPAGNLRVQTQSGGLTNQLQPSQYSRTIAVPTGACTPPQADFSVTTLAYADAARQTPLPSGMPVASGATVYFTYELTNLSSTNSTVVTSVTDAAAGTAPVCSNVTLSPSQTDTSSCQWQTVATPFTAPPTAASPTS